MLFSTIIPSSEGTLVKRKVAWKGKDWALGCYFIGNDLQNIKSLHDDCSGKCAITSGCSHYTWTPESGGICSMKQGPISKEQAIGTDDQTGLCGVIESALSASSSGKEKQADRNEG
jgi:PAN domain